MCPIKETIVMFIKTIYSFFCLYYFRAKNKLQRMYRFFKTFPNVNWFTEMKKKSNNRYTPNGIISHKSWPTKINVNKILY